MQFMPMYRERVKINGFKPAPCPVDRQGQQVPAKQIEPKKNQDIRDIMKSPKIEYMAVRAMSTNQLS